MGDSPLVPAASIASTDAGFYGKLPSHGDFLKRRVSDDFVAVWDNWLQDCLNASRATLGDRWEELYLTSPVWRFACAPGACGPAPVIGVMVPSVDRVGRHFPLTIVVPLAEPVNLLSAATTRQAFFDSAERLLLQTFDSERIDLDRFDRSVIELGAAAAIAPSGVDLDATAADVLADDVWGQWQLPIASSSQLSSALEQILGARLASLYNPLVLWWTEGSGMVEPSCLLGKGLPPPETFTALLDGSWRVSNWRAVGGTVEVTAVLGDTINDATPPRFRSAAATNVGRKRAINQDAFLERTDVGLWVVADGLGGHSEGEVASRMVCDALADFVPDSSFEDVIDGATRRLEEVNDHLSRAATRAVNPVQSGSTVVALMTRGTLAAILWAGDSRVYRWRAGRLEQLTTDHSQAAADGGASTAITRAVGGEPTLVLDVYRDRVHAGDRFLLCSDGLTRTVPDASICTILDTPDIASAVEELIQAALDAGAPDNVTALVVEAYN